MYISSINKYTGVDCIKDLSITVKIGFSKTNGLIATVVKTPMVFAKKGNLHLSNEGVLQAF